MERRSRISLDHPALRGRLKQPRSAARYSSDQTRSFNEIKRPYTHPPAQRAPVALPLPAKPITAQPIPPPSKREVFKRPDLPRQTRSRVLNRQLPEQKKLVTFTRRSNKRQSYTPKLLMALASLLFICGVVAFVNGLRTDQTVKAQVKQLTTQANDDSGITDGLPDETNPPGDISTYAVSPDMPRLLSIDKIGVKARVRRVGVGANNILKAPANIFDVGWYDGGAKPGENGTILLDGHVSGPTQHGVFYNLRSLKPGDTIDLQRGDGKTFTYKVIETKMYDDDAVDMPKVLTSAVAGKPGLNLITCSGRFNVRTNQYEQRVVVFAVEDS